MPRARINRLLLLGLLLASPARGAALAPEPLKIVLVARGGRKVPKAGEDGGPTLAQYQKSWKQLCAQLGGALSVGRGPWGLGVFTETACFRGKKRVGGGDLAARWQLAVVDGAEGVAMTLTFAPGGGEALTVGRLKLPPSPRFLEFFADDEFTDIVAFALLDQLPAAMHASNPLKGRQWRAGLSKDFKFKVPDAPENLLLYRLSWDEGAEQWRSRVVGAAKRGKVTAPRDVVYEPDAAAAEQLKVGDDVWAQDARGPGARAKELAKLGKDAASVLATQAENGNLSNFLRGRPASLLARFLNTAAVGYVGMRYGFEVLPGNELLEKTHIFSLLVEIRGGPLKGLRYYYDKLPPAKVELTGADGSKARSSIAWSRHVLGYSFGFDPGFLIDRLTIDPKLGIWRFDATLPVRDDAHPDAIKVQKFSLGNTFSLALEVGAELLSSWYTLRGWYAIDGGYSLVKSGGTVSSNRFGADAFFTAGPTFPLFGVPFKTALLAFYVYEAVSVDSGAKDSLAPGEVEIAGVPYSAGYAGGGVLVTW